MKKILTSELISIAHRVLKLKNSDDINTLYTESQKLFEKISLLKFYEENKYRLDSDIDIEKLTQDNEVIQETPKHNETEVSSETLSKKCGINEDVETNFTVVPQTEKIEEVVSLSTTPVVEENCTIHTQIVKDTNQEEVPSLEIDAVYNLSFDKIEFEQKEEETEEATIVTKETPQPKVTEQQHIVKSSAHEENIDFQQIPINKTINDAFSRTISISLNDKIAFEKHLFNNSSEDLSRVISQINTMDTYQEAIDFIDDLVKPEFNYWQGKEEFAERFMQLIEKRYL